MAPWHWEIVDSFASAGTDDDGTLKNTLSCLFSQIVFGNLDKNITFKGCACFTRSYELVSPPSILMKKYFINYVITCLIFVSIITWLSSWCRSLSPIKSKLTFTDQTLRVITNIGLYWYEGYHIMWAHASVVEANAGLMAGWADGNLGFVLWLASHLSLSDSLTRL